MINKKLQEILETLRDIPNLINCVAPMTYGEIAEAFLALEKHAEKGWTWAGKLADDRTEQEVRAEKAEAALEEEKDLHDDTVQAMHLWCERAKEAEAKLAELENQEPYGYVHNICDPLKDGTALSIFKQENRHYSRPVFIQPTPVKQQPNTCDACIDVLSALGFHYKTAKLKDVLAEIKRLRVTATSNLVELVLDENDSPQGFTSWYERHFATQPYKGASHVTDCENAWRAAILHNIEEAK